MAKKEIGSVFISSNSVIQYIVMNGSLLMSFFHCVTCVVCKSATNLFNSAILVLLCGWAFHQQFSCSQYFVAVTILLCPPVADATSSGLQQTH